MGRRSRAGEAIACWPAPALFLSLLLGLGPASTPAWARTRPVFEPTDLELENPGAVELDLQLGLVRGPSVWRVVVPDFELDIGLLRNLEVDIDGAYALEGPTGSSGGLFPFDHSAPDSLWPSLKIGIDDWQEADPSEDSAWAVGIQVGPKLPVASGSHGIGFESLVLIGHRLGRLHLVLNLGGLVDPATAQAATRPRGIEAGVDLELEINDNLSVTGEIGGVRYQAPDPSQVVATAGVTRQVSKHLEVSLVALVGFLDGADRYGVLFGLSPKFGRLE